MRALVAAGAVGLVTTHDLSLTAVTERLPGAVNVPLGQLRARLAELPRDREIHVVCRSGQRAHTATRILVQYGFRARNVSGGVLSQPTTSAGAAPAERSAEPQEPQLVR